MSGRWAGLDRARGSRKGAFFFLSALASAPELASLEIVESAVRMALLALLAVHPTLDDFAEPDEPPSLRRARRLLASAASLDTSLRRYRVAVLDAIRPRPAAPVPDDSPF